MVELFSPSQLEFSILPRATKWQLLLPIIIQNLYSTKYSYMAWTNDQQVCRWVLYQPLLSLNTTHNFYSPSICASADIKLHNRTKGQGRFIVNLGYRLKYVTYCYGCCGSATSKVFFWLASFVTPLILKYRKWPTPHINYEDALVYKIFTVTTDDVQT